jgi:hypothetical protein
MRTTLVDLRARSWFMRLSSNKRRNLWQRLFSPCKAFD